MFTKLNTSAEKCAESVVMYEGAEAYLHEEIRRR